MAFKEVAIESLEFNPFTKISKEWMLVTCLLYTSDAADE